MRRQAELWLMARRRLRRARTSCQGGLPENWATFGLKTGTFEQLPNYGAVAETVAGDVSRGPAVARIVAGDCFYRGDRLVMRRIVEDATAGRAVSGKAGTHR